MAKKRVTRKQLLKEPDEFITTTGKLIAWARENTKLLVYGLTAFFLLIITLSVYRYFEEKKLDTAQMMFSQVITKYQVELDKKDPALALTAVEEDFDLLIQDYGSKPIGQLGCIFYGHINVAAQRYDRAIELYRKALDHLGNDSSLSGIVLNGLATAFQQKGEYPKAIEYYGKVVEIKGSVLKDASLFQMGRLYEQLGELEKSREAYHKLNTDYPNSMYTLMVQDKIGEKAQGDSAAPQK